jgi:hypothetical protein
MLPGAVPGSCACPRDTTLQNGKCVAVNRCTPPLVMNADGKCIRPDVPSNRDKPKQKQDQPSGPPRVIEPGRGPGIGIPGIGIPGLGGGLGGGERGGGEKTGR